MPYEFVNDVSDKKIQKLADPTQAEAVIQEIATLAEQTEPVKGDQVNQWLGVLAKDNITAQKVKGSVNTIEVYPGGKGSPDRIFITVGGGTVTVAAVGAASHK
ncbi:hypothetical protein [Pseudomonas sp. CGJS7]|uniref:hypothetical protein n=1 Tax=Pseudomonas sp. CGJS7 TaxID=3109348 RepID=UPI0030095438